LAKLGERHIDIPDVDVDRRFAGFDCRLARDVARRFTVSNDVEQVRPDLVFFHGRQ